MKPIIIFSTVSNLLLATAFLGASEFAVDPARSAIEVDVKATGHDFTARLAKFDLKVTGDASSVTPASASLTWDFKDLETGDKKRDHEMLTWLDHGAHPAGSFKFSSAARVKDGTNWARGTLTFHGVSKQIQFPFTARREGNKVKASGSIRLDHRDYGLKKIRKFGFLTVDPVVTVRFRLEGSIK